MAKTTISTFQLFKLFPDQDSARLKRGLIGVYHSASPKHLHRYVDEFAFRLNDGNVKVRTLDRLDSFVRATAGKRLTYEGLIQ